MRERTFYAQQLRKNQTQAESILWGHLRRKQLGVRFRRQYVLGIYIVDFVCVEKKLIIEVDGESHLVRKQWDDNRTVFLNELGYQVIRFWNTQVFTSLEDVLSQIVHALQHESRDL